MNFKAFFKSDKLNKLHSFLSSVFTFSFKKGIVGILLAILVMLFPHRPITHQTALLYAALFIFSGFLKINLPENSFWKYPINIIWALCIAYITCWIPFPMLNLWEMRTLTLEFLCLNMVVVFILYAFFYLIFAKWRTSVIITSVILVFLASANGFLTQFRGKELSAFDLYSLKTAFCVAEQYKYIISPRMMLGWLIWALAIFTQFSLPSMPEFPKRRSRTVSLVILIFWTFTLFSNTASMQPRTWNTLGTTRHGFYLNFFLGMRDSVILKPEGYSTDYIEKEAEKYKTDITPPDKAPNIIVIMNESFADFRVLGDNFNTNVPVTPFIDSLKENTIRGYALSSVFGANTANSEFEFLTGNTMGFLPQGSVAYQQYINSAIFSLPRALNKLGYTSVATHPFLANGWSRPTVYPYLGFKESTFIESYPQKNLVRKYVSDREMFEYIINQLNEKKKDDPLFLFGVSMQNHSSYNYQGPDFTSTVNLEGYPADYPRANQYLSLLQHTDKATKYLINELKDYPEDTIVLFFGDHFPSVESRFYKDVHRAPFNTLDESMLKYKVPFFIWANYDIEEKEIPCTSLNYLSNYLLDAAEIELSPYHKFLSDMEEHIPAMNSLAYYSKENKCFISYDEASGKEAQWLKKYKWLQYNNMFDTKNTNKTFFEDYK